MPGKPKRSFSPSVIPKAARRREIIAESAQHTYSFRFVDHNGPFCFSRISGDDLRQILYRLGEYERMSPQELANTGSHFVEQEKFSAKAMHRLREIELEETERLYSFRIEGKPRIWAHRDMADEQSTFYIIWCDPDHEVCPSKK